MQDTIIDIANAPWELIINKILRYREKEFNEMIADMTAFSAQTVRNANVKDIEDLLKYFKAPTLTKKKEELIEFLRLMPGYKTSNKYVLHRRLGQFIRRQVMTGGIRDPLLYAKLQNQPEEPPQEEQEEIPNLNEDE